MIIRRSSLLLLATTATLIACDNNSLNLAAVGETTPYESVDFDAVVPEPPLGYALPARGSIYSKTNDVGGNGGTPFSIDCGADSVLAGIEGRAGSLIDQVSALCVAVDDDGQWIGSPAVTGAPKGGGGGGSFRQQCRANQAIVGFTGSTENGVTGYLQAHCRQLVDNNSTTGDLTTLTGVGEAPVITPSMMCADNAVAKGIYGASGGLLDSLGLNCLENPAYAGRWSNVIDWPLIAAHSVLTPQGKVMSFGTTLEGEQGAHFHYDVWDPSLGTATASHATLDNTLGVDSFCSAAVVMPDNGNILMAGGDGRFDRAVNSGIADAPIFNTTTQSLSRAANMISERWYPSATTLANGEILLTGGITSQRQHAVTPEIYSPETNEWRSLTGINTSEYGYMYPRQWVAPDGRVFGTNWHYVYYLDTTGQGSLIPQTGLPDVAVGAGSTAVMYAPGKIFQAGGAGSNGFGAISIDINTGSAVVEVEKPMAEPRITWANALVLADGTVLVLGGSERDNQADGAALGAELWNPQTKDWAQMSRTQLPRLYHSTSVLLQDGTVLLAGGGAPGPLINRNAEIYSPPYLYDDNGSLKQRPVITTAAKFAAYGQSIPVTTEGGNISRVTLVKSSAVTHSYNMEQRFMDLEFTGVSGVIDVQLPANANLATPGYYLLFVFDDTDTPSVSHMLKMGTIPAPVPEIVPPTPEPPTDTPDNLLVNGGFEQAKTNWNDCSDASFTTATNAASDGSGAMKVQTGGCLYQEFTVDPGVEYNYECDAMIGAADYASVFLQISDSDYTELGLAEKQVLSSDYAVYSGSLLAPANSRFASLGLYSEGNATFDRCSVTAVIDGNPPEPQPPVPVPPTQPTTVNLLQNGGFEQQKNSWFDCSATSLTNASTDAFLGNGALEVNGSGCIYQEIAVSPGVQYRMHCSAKSEGSQYTSISWQITDQVRTEIDALEIPVGNTQYKSYEATLTSPAESAFSAVTLYSEDVGLFDNCFIEAL